MLFAVNNGHNTASKNLSTLWPSLTRPPGVSFVIPMVKLAKANSEAQPGEFKWPHPVPSALCLLFVWQRNPTHCQPQVRSMSSWQLVSLCSWPGSSCALSLLCNMCLLVQEAGASCSSCALVVPASDGHDRMQSDEARPGRVGSGPS